MASDSYRPQSPDLSSLHTNLTTGYRPQSPDLSALPGPQQSYRHLQSSEHDNSARTALQQPTSAAFVQPGAAMKMEQADQEMPDASSTKDSKRAINNENDPTLGVVLKTSFPVARIKRIMQADEDIGKVAQVTPHVVSRALELFMIKLITAAAEQARGPGGANSKGPRRVLAQHMKKAIQADETFDFLADIVAKIPDAPTKSKKEATSDSEDTKPKKRAKKRKDSKEDV